MFDTMHGTTNYIESWLRIEGKANQCHQSFPLSQVISGRDSILTNKQLRSYVSLEGLSVSILTDITDNFNSCTGFCRILATLLDLRAQCLPCKEVTEIWGLMWCCKDSAKPCTVLSSGNLYHISFWCHVKRTLPAHLSLVFCYGVTNFLSIS